MSTLGEIHSKDNSNKLQKVKSLLTKKNTLKPAKKPTRVIKPGDIFLIKADKSNGITPKNGQNFRWKYFIVVGKLSDGSLHCCAVFDSEKNREYIEPRFDEFYMLVKAGKYSFLKHDSYIDCLVLKNASSQKLLKGLYKGSLTAEDLAEVFRLIKLNPRHTPVYLNLWGIK